MIEKPEFSEKNKIENNREGKIKRKEFYCGCIFEGEFIGSNFRGNVILCDKHLLEIRQQKSKI